MRMISIKEIAKKVQYQDLDLIPQGLKVMKMIVIVFLSQYLDEGIKIVKDELDH